jgi:hypothetical protein
MTDFTAVSDGAWSAYKTWGADPSGTNMDNKTVAIPTGMTVVFDVDQHAFTTGLAGLTITSTGKLTFPTANPCTVPDATSDAALRTAITSNITAASTTSVTVATNEGKKFSSGMTTTLTDGVHSETVVITTVSGDTLTIPVTTYSYTSTAPIAYFEVGYQVLHPYLKMKTGISISGTGTLQVGNSTTDYIPFPATWTTGGASPGTWASGNQTTIELIAAGAITASAQKYYGQLQTLPYTTLTGAGSTNSGTDTIWLAANMGLQVGQQILIGNGSKNAVMTEAANGLYTVSALTSGAAATIGATSAYPVVLTVPLPATDGARTVGDIVAIYSRPILIYKSTYATTTAGTAASQVMNGVRSYQTSITSGASWAMNGVTFDGNLAAVIYLTLGVGASVTDSVLFNTTQNEAFCGGAYGNQYNRCAGINVASTFEYNSAGTRQALYSGCALQNTTRGMLNIAADCTLSNCVSKNSTNTTLGMNIAGTKIYNCTSAGTASDMGAAFDTELYNSTLTTTTLTSANLQPTWSNNQARACTIGGTLYTMYCWTKGGTAYTQSTTVHGARETLRLAVDGTYGANNPIFWNWRTYAPPNQTISFSVVGTKDIVGGTFRLQIIDPTADPLWSSSNAVLAEANMDAAYSANIATPTWGNYTVNYKSTNINGQPVIVRLLFQNTTTSGNAYADVLPIEQSFKKKKMYVL